jgi:hypothetical protein
MTLVSRVSIVYKQSESQTQSDAWSITPGMWRQNYVVNKAAPQGWRSSQAPGADGTRDWQPQASEVGRDGGGGDAQGQELKRAMTWVRKPKLQAPSSAGEAARDYPAVEKVERRESEVT